MNKRYKVFIDLIACLCFITLNGCVSGPSRVVKNFDFNWKFAKANISGAHRLGFNDSRWRNVQIPHDWSIEGPYSQDYASGTGFLPGGIGWYRKTFQLDPSDRGRRIVIEFDGVYNHSQVWINGQYLGNRPFGYIGFEYDLTPHVVYGAQDNIIAVRVDHSRFADSRWYTGSGIYRHVRLKITDALHIDQWGTFVTTPIARKDVAQVQIETAVKNESVGTRTFTLESIIRDPDGKNVATLRTDEVIDAGATQTIVQQAGFVNPRLWSPDDPALYSVQNRIIARGGVIDETSARFGIRSFRFDPDRGFFLNGVNMKLKGVCLHHDAGPVGAAVPRQMWVRRFKALKEIGCNAIRCSHNPMAPEFMDLCDEMGFLVQAEAFDEFTPTKNKWIEGWNKGTPSRDGYGQVFEEWCIRDIQDLVKRDRNHPSIIMWSIGNEIDYRNDPFTHPSLGDEYRPGNPPAENLVKYGKPLVEAVKQLDPTRPTTAALATATMSNAVGFSDLLDVVGYNYQEKLYEDHHAQYPDRVLYGSENSSSLEAWEAVEKNDFISAQFIWTGIDYLGEAGAWPWKSWNRSMFDLCGFKKPSAWFRQSLWTTEPMVYLACRTGEQRRAPVQSHWNWQSDEEVRVICYTNCDEVELFLNGRSLGSKLYAEARQRTLRWRVPYKAGTLTAKAKRRGQTVAEYALQTAGPAKKIELIADTTRLRSNGTDICHLEFRVTDENGLVVPEAEHQITFTLNGPGRIIGLGNGNSQSRESHQGNTRKTFNGRGLAIIQSEKEQGAILIQADSPGIESGKIVLRSTALKLRDTQ